MAPLIYLSNSISTIILSSRCTKEKKWWVATCVEVDVASQGRTKASALSNLAEALELYYQDPLPSIKRGLSRLKA